MSRKTSCASAIAIALVITAAGGTRSAARGGATQTSDYTFAAVATTATPIPAGAGTFVFQFASEPAIDDGHVAFVAQGSNNQRGVYLATGGALQRLADTTTALPTPDTRLQNSIFTNFLVGSPSLRGSTVAFGGSGTGTLAANGAVLTVRGLYASEVVAGASGPVRQIRNIVQDDFTDLPGGPADGKFKTSFSPSVGDGVIAFTADGRFPGVTTPFQGIYLDSGGGLSVLADTATDVPNPPSGLVNVHFDAFGPPSVDGIEIAFQGAFFDRRLFSIYSTVGGLHSIARTGQGAPDASGVFSNFLYGIVSSAVLDGQAITFLSTLENNLGNFAGTGVFTTDGGTAHAVATSRDDTPDRDSILHTFGNPSASGGHLAFLATGLDSVEVLYSNLGGTLHRVIGVGDVLNGNTIAELAFGKEGLSGDTLAFFAKFDDGSSGIFTATREELDATPPEIEAVISPGPNAAGWNNTAPTVTWSVQDPDSGIAASTGCAATTVSADTSATVLTCSATNGDGLQNSKSVMVKLDTAAPSIAGSRAPLPNPNGWTNGSVTVSFICSEAGSGVASCASSTVVSTDGAGQSVTGTAVDAAGNTATAVVGAINIDMTPPVVTASVSRAPDMNGWYNHPFGASWSSTDALSDIDACIVPVSPYAGPDTGAGQLIGTCTDRAGNSASASVAFKYDASPPSITIAQPADGATFALNQAAPAASYTCSDAGGVATCAGSVPSGTPINTSIPGAGSVTVNAVDAAGNAATLTHRYTVSYAFEGFLSPLNNLPTTNRGPAGRTYAVKWILRDGNGTYISDPASISGVTLVPGSCSGAAAEVAGEDTAVQVSGLRFDPATGIWHFNWQTQKSQVGCWSLQVRLADGSVRAIAFELR